MRSTLMRYLEASLEEYEEAPVPADVVATGEAPVETQEVEVISGPTPPVVEGAVTPAPLPVEHNTEITPVAEVTTDQPAGAEQEAINSIDEGQPLTGEEVLEIEAAVDSDSTLDKIDQDQVEQTIIAGQIDDMLDTQQSLEAYAGLLKQAGLDGISQQTAAFMNVGLKRIERQLGLNKICPGLEAYDASPRSGITKASVSLEDIKEYAKKAFEKVMELIRKLIQQIVAGYHNLSTGITGVENKIGKLRIAADKLKNATPPHIEIEIKDPYLYADGKFKLEDTKSLSGLAHFSSYTYPAAVKKYYEGLAKIVKSWDPLRGDANAVVEKLMSFTAPLDDLYSDNEILPGNFAIDIAADGIVYGIKKVDSAKEPHYREITPRSPRELLKQLQLLADITAITKAAPDEHGKIKEGAKALLDASTALEQKASKAEFDESSKQAIQQVVNAIAELIRKSNPRSREITTYIVRAINGHLHVIRNEVTSFVQKPEERE